jgi:hypothetical protein
MPALLAGDRLDSYVALPGLERKNVEAGGAAARARYTPPTKTAFVRSSPQSPTRPDDAGRPPCRPTRPATRAGS